MTTIEDMTYAGLLGIVGDNPMFLGLLLLGGLTGVVFLMPVRSDVKLMVITPAILLAAGTIEVLRPILFIAGMAIIGFAALKFINH